MPSDRLDSISVAQYWDALATRTKLGEFPPGVLMAMRQAFFTGVSAAIDIAARTDTDEEVMALCIEASDGGLVPVDQWRYGSPPILLASVEGEDADAT